MSWASGRLTRESLGVEGGAKAAREDVVGALLRFVRADKAVSFPLRLLFPPLPLLFLEEKGRKKQVGPQNYKLLITSIASITNNSPHAIFTK